MAGTRLLAQPSIMADSSVNVRPPKCRFGARCWRPACAYHHEESEERRQHLAQLASFWAGCAPCGGHVQSNGGLAECLVEVSCLREVVKKLAANVMWSNGALHLSSNVGMDLPAEVDSGGVHVTGKEDGKPCRQAGDDACLAGASRADDSSAQLKSERDTGSVVEPGWTTRRRRRRLSVTMVLPTMMRLSDAGESAALILTQGTNSPRGTRSTLDLPMEREYPPGGTHSGMVSSLVSRWESDTRSQSPGQGLEPSSGARMAGSQLSRSQENGASNLEASNTPVSSNVPVSDGGKTSKALPNSRRRSAARKAKSELQDGYSSMAAALTQLAGRVDPNSPQARKVHSVANLLLEDYQRDGEMIPGIDVDMSDLRRLATRLPGS